MTRPRPYPLPLFPPLAYAVVLGPLTLGYVILVGVLLALCLEDEE